MEIQKADLRDAEEILKIQHAAFQSEAEIYNDFEIPPLTQTVDDLRADFANKTVLKVIKGKMIVASGQYLFVAGTCHIGRMAVLPAFQGQGIGSMLLSALENSCSDALRYELFTGERSEFNLSMYKRRGYQEFKRASLGKTTIIFLERGA